MRFALPSRWSLRLIDLLFIAIIVALIARFVAPTSGLYIVFQQAFHLLALAVQWIANVLVMFLNWI